MLGDVQEEFFAKPDRFSTPFCLQAVEPGTDPVIFVVKFDHGAGELQLGPVMSGECHVPVDAHPDERQFNLSTAVHLTTFFLESSYH